MGRTIHTAVVSLTVVGICVLNPASVMALGVDSPPLGSSARASGDGVDFSVWAPNAESVSVIGAFNQWDPKADPMRKDSTGVWRAHAEFARPGHEYLFVIDGSLERRDPRAREISISGMGVVVPPPSPPSSPPSPSALRDLVIYQIHPSTFYDPDPRDNRPGTLDDAVSKLDHLKELGINCILLMPVVEFPGDKSWGYNPTDLFAIEPAYGGREALRRFVAECHKRGIAVHIDVVHNHYGPNGLDIWDFDTKGTDLADRHPGGIYFYNDPKMGKTPWGPRPDFGRREVRQFISDQVKMWFDEYGADGLRWDSTVNIRATDGGHRINPEGERLLDQITRMIRREYPDKINIAEDSPRDPRFDASWDYGFHGHGTEGLVGNILRPPSEVDVSDIFSRVRSDMGFSRVIYSESHDEAGLLNSKTRLLSKIDPENPLSLKARRLAALAAVATMTSPGIPMIFMGQDIAETGHFHDDRPLDWAQDQRRQGMLMLYRDLVFLRRNLSGSTPSLQSPRVREILADQEKKVLAYRRYISSRPESDLVVVLNFSDSESTVDINFPRAGLWKTVLSTGFPRYNLEAEKIPEEIRVGSSSRATLSLPPQSAHIFSQNSISFPEIIPSGLELSPPSASPLPVEAKPHPEPALTPDHDEASDAPETSSSDQSPPRSSLFLSANFTDPPWQIGRDDLKMGMVEEGVWQIDITMHNASGVELKIADAATGLEFGASYVAVTPVPSEGYLKEDGPPLSLSGVLNGDYRLTFNERSLKYRFEKRANTGLEWVNIVSNLNQWSRTSDPMFMAADHLWQTDLEGPPGEPVEFVVVANGDLQKQWGSFDENQREGEWSALSQVLGSPFKTVVPPSGAFRISFNEKTEEISCRPLSLEEIPPRPSPPPPEPVGEVNHPLDQE